MMVVGYRVCKEGRGCYCCCDWVAEGYVWIMIVYGSYCVGDVELCCDCYYTISGV